MYYRLSAANLQFCPELGRHGRAVIALADGIKNSLFTFGICYNGARCIIWPHTGAVQMEIATNR
jgi:hypothetical protein